MLKIEVSGDQELMARLDAMPDAVRAALIKKSWALTLKLEARIKGKLSGPVLNVRTGALRRSIFSNVEQTDDKVVGKAASSGDVKYGRIHEFGGKTPPHEIVPVKARVLAFMKGGKMMFAHKVRHPGSVMPERSFMRSSLGDMKEEIIDGLTEAVKEGVAKE